LRKLNYYQNLDGVRAIAALMVVVFHFFRDLTPDTQFLSIVKDISYFGQTGVTLFFVLSGFLITRILIYTKETEGFFKNFYLRRTLRIFPLYYLFLLIWFFIAPLIITMEPTTFSQQFYYYSYLQNFARTFDWDVAGPTHFWSLSVEEHFYLFWPFMVFFLSKKNMFRSIFIIILFSIVLRAIMIDSDYSVFIFTFTRFDSLAIGSLLALLELRKFFRPENSRKFLVLLGGSVISIGLLYAFLSEEFGDYRQNIRYLLFSLIYFATIGFLLCIKNGHVINRFLKTGFLNYTGKISYGLYVYHPLVFLICAEHFETDFLALNFIIGLILSYLIAGLSYHFFESRFLSLKKYFDYKKTSESTKMTKISS